MQYKNKSESQSEEQPERVRRWPVACLLWATVVVIATSAGGDAEWRDSLVLNSTALQAAAMQGHILLLHDTCHRVLDDPSSVNRYSFRTHQQYVNYCVERKLRDVAKPYIKPRLA